LDFWASAGNAATTVEARVAAKKIRAMSFKDVTETAFL
jgi:hypothetical protein